MNHDNISIEELVFIYQNTEVNKAKLEAVIREKLEDHIRQMHGDLFVQAMTQYYLDFRMYQTVKFEEIRKTLLN